MGGENQIVSRRSPLSLPCDPFAPNRVNRSIKNTDEFRLFYVIEHERLGTTEVELQIQRNKKSLYIDGEPILRLADFIGTFPVVPMHSGDLMLLKVLRPSGGVFLI